MFTSLELGLSVDKFSISLNISNFLLLSISVCKFSFYNSSNIPISFRSCPPLIGGCLKAGVRKISKSPNSFKNLEIYSMILNISSLLGWQCISNSSIALLYSTTGSNPFSSITCQYLQRSKVLKGLYNNKKFSMVEIASFSLNN